MKKKLTLSVTDIINNKSPHPQTENHKPPISTSTSNKPTRFEDMYMQVVQHGHIKNGVKVMYDSKKATPIVTPVNTFRNYCSNKVSRKGSLQQISLPNSHSHTKNNRQMPSISSKYRSLLLKMDHSHHSHMRQNQCFLSEQQIEKIMQDLGYNTKLKVYGKMLQILEVDIYGGLPSNNLLAFLMIIENKQDLWDKKQNLNNSNRNKSKQKALPRKIITNNLQLQVSNIQKQQIFEYFANFKAHQEYEYCPQENPNIKELLAEMQELSQFKDCEEQEELLLGKETDYDHYQSDLKSGVKMLRECKQGSEQNKQKQNKQGQNKQEKNKYKQNTSEKREQKETALANLTTNSTNLTETTQEDIITLKNKLNQALSSSLSSSFPPPPPKYGSKPILSVDVNLGDGISQKIIVFEGESAKHVSNRLASKFTITDETKLKFEKMLQAHLNTMLWKIDEEDNEDMATEREQEMKGY